MSLRLVSSGEALNAFVPPTLIVWYPISSLKAGYLWEEPIVVLSSIAVPVVGLSSSGDTIELFRTSCFVELEHDRLVTDLVLERL